ncbi:MAG: proline dehydrogenase family protein [Acidobacteria bacterium]|nr:proline dehydrogenase family protein [Acidobacteriota bacterium]MBI3664536.1 proline dehydrogenase family protein [Acidobacteriota bacterium]
MIVRDFIFWLSTKKKVTDAIARRGIKNGFALRFIAGEKIEDAIRACQELNREGRRISLNHLGENVTTVEEASNVRDGYVEMVRELDRCGIDGNISVKLTQLGLDVKPGGRELCQQLTDEILAQATRLGRDIEIDMEGSPYTDATLDIFEAVRRKRENAGLAIQAYLYRSEKDIERLAPLHPKIRLVKGAYREPRSIAYQKKLDVDASYCRLLDELLDGRFVTAIATHDSAMLDHARKRIAERGLGHDKYEFQMIYGIRRDLQQEIREQGHPLRIYVPYGTEWCPYFMRRLSERPANCWFVVKNLMAEIFTGNGSKR